MVRYAIGIAAVAVALILKFALVPLVTQETPFLLFFTAVMVAAWCGGFGPGLLVTAFSALLSDYFFMTPFYKFEVLNRVEWSKLAMFVCEGTLISMLCAMVRSARERAEVNAEQVRILQERIIDVREREEQRIGRDLHDGLGQHLTGIAFLSRLLSQRLTGKSLPEAAEATKIEELVNDATRQARELASGLSPVAVDAGGLASGLQALAGETQDIFHIVCAFACETPVEIKDASVATSLYRIAQEAVTNALKHGKARQIRIELSVVGGSLRMLVEDNGTGFSGLSPAGEGMGLQSMRYRARMIGASLDIGPGERGGTSVTCVLLNYLRSEA